MRAGARGHVNIERTVVVDRSLRGNCDTGLFAGLEPALFLVDGGNLLWRAAHGHAAPFPADDGRDLTPLFRFFSMLRRALGTYGLFAECVVCFDGADAWSSRLEVDPQYKSNRRYADRDLWFLGWLPEIRAALNSAGVATVELQDQEADDVIASLTASVTTPRPVRILSTDRDYFQLLGEAVTAVNPKLQPALVDEPQLAARYGVRAAQWCDFRALAGDVSDGIPGVPGVGPKRAAQMLATGRPLEDLAAEHWPDVRRWRELIRLRTDVETGVVPSATPTPPLPSPVAVCRELGLIA